MAEVTKARRKRIAEFIEPLTGAARHPRATSARTSTRATGPTCQEEGRRRAAADGHRRCWPSTRRGWPPRTPTACSLCLQSLDAGGKDGTIRHVMSGVNPQGVHVSSFKVPSAEELDHDYLWRYARRLPARGRHRRSSTGRTTRRSSWCGSTPRSSPARSCRRWAKGDGHLGPPLPGDQRLGALPGRQRVPGREDLPEPVQGGAAHPLPQADRRPGAELEVLGRRRPRTPSGGTTTSAPSPRCCRPPARSARRGTSSRPTASGSPASAPAAVLAHTLIEIDPQLPDGRRGRPRASSGRRRELEAAGARGRRARPVRRRRTDGHRKARARATAGGRTPGAPRRHGTRPASAEIGGTGWTRSTHRRDQAPRRRWYARSPEDVAAGARRRPGGRALRRRGGGAAARERPERAARGAAAAGLAALPRAVPQLHADHPGRRRGRVAADRRSGAPRSCCSC